MSYADTDFFLALIKENDWLKEQAIAILKSHKGEIWASAATIVELLFICNKTNLDPEKVIVSVFRLAEINGMDEKIAVTAAHYMKKYNSSPVDSIHAAYAVNDKIISSDSIFDSLGIERIKLEKKQKS